LLGKYTQYQNISVVRDDVADVIIKVEDFLKDLVRDTKNNTLSFEEQTSKNHTTFDHQGNNTEIESL